MNPRLSHLIRRLGDLPPENPALYGKRLLAFLWPYAKSNSIQEALKLVGVVVRKYREMKFFQFFKDEVTRGFQWIGRYVPIRHRYVLTKHNRVRMRYVLPSLTVCLVMAIMTLGGFMAESRAVHVGDFLVSVYQADGAEGKVAYTQKRLARYTDVADSQNVLKQASLTQKTIAQPKEKALKLRKGDTLAGVLQKAGVGASEAYKAVMAMEDHYDPRKVRAGQEIHVRFDPVDEAGSAYQFSQMKIDIDPIKSVNLLRTGEDGFQASILEKEITRQVYASRADIEVSLYGSADKAGIPASIIAQAIHIYSWDVDFQRDIRKGDALEIMYEQLETPEGLRVKSGDVIYARLDVNGQDIPVYRFETADGDFDYFTDKGVSIRKALMLTPIDGARLSSGFGMRKHPVLGYNKMHKGVDFAAPSGTPIYAAGDGTVERAGRWNSYGNYIRIRHNATLKTAYAHLKGFAKGVSVGKRVKQGQVIGYVGTTGRSTGPHLHYEVLQNNRQVNPKKINMPQGETLKGDQLKAFNKHVEKLNRQYAALTKGTTLASRRQHKDSKLR